MLISTTLAGPGAEASIVDALRSCAHLVDYHYVLLSGCDKAAVKAAITASYYDGLKKVIWRDYEWPNSYGEARTEALRRAELMGATWALTVDCDERLDIPELEPPPKGFDALTVGDRDLLYQKPRLLRCNAGLRWEWPCAERLVGPDGNPPEMARIKGQFWELPKDAEAEKRRALRGVEHMPKLLAEAENAHARRHLAECLLTLGRPEEARGHFVRVSGDADAQMFERTWCRYRLAELYCVDGDFVNARMTAALALAEDPGLIQELGWVIAHANAQLKDYTAAALWASYVLMAPMDESRGGHRSRTWRAGAEGLLKSIEAAARAQSPQEWTRETFAARADFAPDYAIVARALVETLSFEWCLDLGAGTGLLVSALQPIAKVFGLEASAEAESVTNRAWRGLIDFGRPLDRWADGSPYDLVSCVEVGEHIPAEQADTLVDAICSRSRRWVYFSAAQPGQGGLGHVNEQLPEYWAEKFRARGWCIDESATRSFVAKLADIRQCTWLQRNALILRKS